MSTIDDAKHFYIYVQSNITKEILVEIFFFLTN